MLEKIRHEVLVDLRREFRRSLRRRRSRLFGRRGSPGFGSSGSACSGLATISPVLDSRTIVIHVLLAATLSGPFVLDVVPENRRVDDLLDRFISGRNFRLINRLWVDAGPDPVTWIKFRFGSLPPESNFSSVSVLRVLVLLDPVQRREIFILLLIR